MKYNLKRLVALSVVIASGCAAAVAGNWYLNLKRVSWPSFATVNQPFSLEFSLENTGSEPVQSVDVKYSPMGGTEMTVHYDFDEPIEPAATANFTVDGFVCDVTGKEIFGRFILELVNGEQNSGSDAYAYIVCGNRYIKRNLVIEEATGTTCQYCPEGIVGMEHMRETYTDGSWIGISVFNDADLDLTSTIYKSWYSRVGSTPNAIANRDFASNYRPNIYTLEDLYQRTVKDAAMVGIRASVDADAELKQATVDVQTFYAFDESDANYKISYVITEDNVGPYIQYNNYAGGTTEMGGWENRPFRTSYTYTDVARKGSIYAGLDESIPTELRSDTDYSYTLTADLSYVDDINNAYINILVLNKSGVIENAIRRKLDGSQNDNLSQSAVMEIMPDTAAGTATVVGIYDICGRKVTNPSSGIYIERRSDGSTRKVRY